MFPVRLVVITGVALAAAAVMAAYVLLIDRSRAVAPDNHAAHGPAAVEMSEARMASIGIELAKAGPGILRQSLVLNGTMQPNQEALVQVTPRFPGIVREVLKKIGDPVQQNELLARIESNQSLTVYDVRAPLPGTIIDRQGTLGEYVAEQRPIFTIADLSTIWIDFSIRRRDLQNVRVGDAVSVDPGDGGAIVEAKISYISPIGNSATQSAVARATIANEDRRLRPGLFVVGRVTLSEKAIDIGIPPSALQMLDGRTVVFVRNGERFEAREVAVGVRDREIVEIVFGLVEGDIYAASNSSTIRDEISKRTTAHDH